METQEFKEKISKVANILKMSIEFPNDEDMKWHRWGYLRNGDRVIRISNGDYQGEHKLHISGEFPRTIRGEYGHYGNPISINVTTEKSPERIAGDIEKRLYPEYIPKLDEAIERVRKTNEYHRNREANIKKMADYFGIEFKPDKEPSIYVYRQIEGLGSRIEASGENTVKFELELTPEKAIEVFNLLK